MKQNIITNKDKKNIFLILNLDFEDFYSLFIEKKNINEKLKKIVEKKENKEKYFKFSKEILEMKNKIIQLENYFKSLTTLGKINFYNKFFKLSNLSVEKPKLDFKEEDRTIVANTKYASDIAKYNESFYLTDYRKKVIKKFDIEYLDYVFNTKMVKYFFKTYKSYDVILSVIEFYYKEFETIESGIFLVNFKKEKNIEISEKEKEFLNEIFF